MHSARVPGPPQWRSSARFRRHPCYPWPALDTLEPPPTTVLLSAEEAKDRLIIEGSSSGGSRARHRPPKSRYGHRGSSEVRGMTDPPGSLQSFR
jgi:hypothetical protein